MEKMDCFSIDANEETARNGENEASMVCSDAYPSHRRSKSTTDQNLDASTHGVPHSMGKNPNESHDLHHLPSNCGARPQSHLHPYFSDTKSRASSKHRASLEKDIDQLQLRLQQEKSVRIMLERAMGRASSALSPGHRHFATQTKELIAEIESLEEEVANHEQHVLSLYRTIFDNCVSGAPSEQNSGMSSPAHTKNEGRKHPSVISSAFCSSRKFHLQPFQALAFIRDSGKKALLLQSRTRHSSLLNGKSSFNFEKNSLDPTKVHERVPTVEKTSLARSLKDHLYQCPSKLSEELVRCMAAIYCWLRSAASAKLEKKHSPILSRSSTNVILPSRSTGEDRDLSCKSVIEISWISIDKNQFSHASGALANYRVLVEQLERVNASHMESNAQMAFWINVYNALLMHAYLAYGIPNGSLRRIALFRKAAYNIGGYVISASAIEQSIFCFRTPRLGRWFEAILSTAMRKKTGEEKQKIGSRFSLQKSHDLIFFSLCGGAFSDPMLKVYTANGIKEELEVAKKEFLQSNVTVKKSRKIFLPKILERFAKEHSISLDDLLKWVSENVDKKLRDSIQKCFDHKTKRKASDIIEWLPYNTRFRYVISKDLTEKPWWV